ncbi:hypothetical protein ACTWP5_31305 [Streptomyces sp. 4N509B]|uniref:hypothetical protein n=1 Tax=Streptomyces sp. 4N509B TaxID=3457413 RepID=UPI003FD41177
MSGSHRTLAEKLQWLREMKTPRGEPAPSYEALARQITQATGVSISGPYVWELATGRSTNPKLHHLQALARFFAVPVAYLAEEHTDTEQLESELELLHALKGQGVRSITVQGTTETQADLAVVQGLLGRLQPPDPPGGGRLRELLAALAPSQRATLANVLADHRTLDALGSEPLRELLRLSAHLTDDQLPAAADLLRDPELLDAVGREAVRAIALRAADLSDASQQAVLALVEHLRQIES